MLKLPYTRKINLPQLMSDLNLNDEWFLCACPINPSGSISLIFSHEENDDYFYDDDEYEENTDHRYVIAVQTWDGHYTTTFSLNYCDLALVQFAPLPNGYYTVVRDRDNENFIELYNTTTQEHTKFSIGYDVNRVGVKSTGEFVVGYNWVENTPAVIVFSPEGTILWTHYNEFAKGCLDLNIDSDDNICFLCTPENKLYRILGTNYVWIEEFQMPIANCVGFTAETDTSHLERPPHCLLVDSFSNYYYWYNDTLYPCYMEKDNDTYPNMSSFYSDRFAIALDNSTLVLGCASNIDTNEINISKEIRPEEVIGFPTCSNILQHLHTSDKLGTTFRHANAPSISYVGHGKEIELVYGHIDEEDNLSIWEYHFNSEHYNKLRIIRSGADNNFYAAIWSTISSENGHPTPVRITTSVPKGRLYSITSNPRRFIETNVVYEVQIACYQASKVKYYDENSELLLSPESIISYESLNNSSEPYAVITGQIQKITKKYNPYTGIPFVHFTVNCMDLILDVLVENNEETNHLKPGSYLQGTFQLSAKIK